MTDQTSCPRCGAQHVTFHGHAACTAHRRDKTACTQPPVAGTNVCRFHGGSAKAVKAAAAARVVEDNIRRELVRFGVPVDVSPTEALLEEVRWSAGHVAWLRQKVREVIGDDERTASGTHPLVWGTTKQVDKEATKHPGTDVTEAGQVSIWWKLYSEERDRLAAISTAAIRAGVEERRVRLAEQQGDAIVDAIRAILADLGLTPQQQVLVGTVVPRHLRLLATGGPQ